MYPLPKILPPPPTPTPLDSQLFYTPSMFKSNQQYYQAPKRLNECIYLTSASVPSWSKQHLVLHVEDDRGWCHCTGLPLKILQSKQLLLLSLQPFEHSKWHREMKDLHNKDFFKFKFLFFLYL
jgi:hypothetical protein